jgi:hypothetical protein
MSRDSPKGLHRMDYYNKIQDFINYALSNPRNISGDRIRYPFKRCKKKFNPHVVTMHLLKKKVH